jgi:murein DD-endopeptidase MepM/ murein hydrolase activator NlpD
MESNVPLSSVLIQNREIFHKVVPVESERDKFVSLDLTKTNPALTAEIYGDTERFSQFVANHIKASGATYAIGGYDELRVVYSRSDVFNPAVAAGEPRRRHLGIDIWAVAGTPVFAPLDGKVHSVGFNNSFGDYGATIILEHELSGIKFHTLYGHLRAADLSYNPGDFIPRGMFFCGFGLPHENGNWPPHLHFQLINEIGDYKGDYPGVCAEKDRPYYLQNCPDPDLILQCNYLAT